MDQDHFLQMLAKVYRELMILGFISLTLVLSLEFDAPYTHNHKALMHFEFAHLLIFFWAMIYVTNSLICVGRLGKCRMTWDRVANTDTKRLCSRVERKLMRSEIGGAGDEEVEEAGDGEAGMRPDEVADAIEAKLGPDETGSWAPFWMTLVPYWDVGYEDLEWKIMQRIFLRNFKLPHEFDYTKYLRSKLMDALASSLEIRPVTWSIVIAMTLIYSGFAYIWEMMYYPDEEGSGSGGAADAGHRRQLGGGGDQADAGGHKLTPLVAQVQVMVMLAFGWILVISNTYILWLVHKHPPTHLVSGDV